jgi:transmembrane sensor
MTNDNSYQPGPEDLELTRILDKEQSAKEESDTSDPLLPFLQQYKASAELKTKELPDPGLYRSLQNKIDPDNSRRTVLRLHPVIRRVAAVLLIAALLSLIYLFADFQKPDLIAESYVDSIELTLFDGSAVTLRPNSRLYRIEETELEQRYKIDGEAFFEVEQVEERSFFVHSDYATAEVTGTSFIISSWGGRSRVYLESGSLLFSLPDGSGTVALTPGQFSTTINGAIRSPVMEDQDTYLGWLQNELVMDSRPLADVTDEISHHFNITVTVPDQLRDEELSGTLLLDDPEQILQDIAISTGLNLDRVGESHYRFTEN